MSSIYFVTPQTPTNQVHTLAGGKAANLARIDQCGLMTTPWVAITWPAFELFVQSANLKQKLAASSNIPSHQLGNFSKEVECLFHQASFPLVLEESLKKALEEAKLSECYVAVRSSGLDEDSPKHSFAGQFSSFLYRKGIDSIIDAIKECWASAYSERGLSYRQQHGLTMDSIAVGVVIQKMVNSRVSGVSFSLNPTDPTDREHLIIDAVLGQGEGLVSGLLDADHYVMHRQTFSVACTVATKFHAMSQAPEGGLVKTLVEPSLQNQPALTESEIRLVANMTLALEKYLGCPQDCEWAFEGDQLYCLQARPITTLPSDAFFDPKINGQNLCLWDNSNIIESYCGITSPLTFSFAQAAYTQVYKQFCEVIGIPQNVIDEHAFTFRNMLGLVRGRIYYNLFNWYKLVRLLPGSSDNERFMETMLGVKQTLKNELTAAMEASKSSHSFSLPKKAKLWALSLYRFFVLDHLVEQFMKQFNEVYDRARVQNFCQLSLPELTAYYSYLEEQVLKRWQVPIINDCFCMVFFGLLKKLTERWIQPASLAASLPNDLLCGQGDLASAEPTKVLMRLAQKIDQDPVLSCWLTQTSAEKVWQALKQGLYPDFKQAIDDYLHRFGFRCINELKLEESTLHDNLSFVIDMLASYVRLKNYSVEQMHARERAIVEKAQELLQKQLRGWRCRLYLWVLRQARNAICYRENLRFARTKIFGVIRELFRGVGHHFHALGLLDKPRDIFYLTVDEIFSFIEGRSCTLNLKGLVALRQEEYRDFHHSISMPDRLITRGAAGASMLYPMLLAASEIGKPESCADSDPSKLRGVPCCPGVVEGVVRVVHEMSDAQGLKGEILVAERTDPGWVPLYPSCSGLLIERGSLLSHSAVIARELGLPTIVGVSGGLMKKLKSGQRVRMDGSTGEIQILGE